jgi:hypothetical protein
MGKDRSHETARDDRAKVKNPQSDSYNPTGERGGAKDAAQREQESVETRATAAKPQTKTSNPDSTRY